MTRHPLANTTTEASAELTARSAEHALKANGRDGAWLLKTAHAIAHDYQRRTGSHLADKHDDLVQFLALTGLRAASAYQPGKSGADYTFDSYIWDIMERRITDFFRRKSEGFGDRRHGHDNRVILPQYEADLDDVVDPEIQIDAYIAERLIRRCKRAADRLGMPLEKWISGTLNNTLADLEETWAAEDREAA
jgi:DNA-directed RNA polymerase specialized sigma subunit